MHGNGIEPRASQDEGPLNESQCTRARGLKLETNTNCEGRSRGCRGRAVQRGAQSTQINTPLPAVPRWLCDIREQAASLSINKT